MQERVEALGQLGFLNLAQTFTIVLIPITGSERSVLHAKSIREGDGSDRTNHGMNLEKLAEALIPGVHNHTKLTSIEGFDRFRTWCVLPKPFLALVVDGYWHTSREFWCKRFQSPMLTPFEVG